MADINRIRRNYKKLIDLNAPKGDIQDYLDSEGVTIDQLGILDGKPSVTPPISNNVTINKPTALLRSAPKIGGGMKSLPSKAAPFWTAVRAGMPANVKTQIQRFADARGIPVEKYSIVDGEIYYFDDKDQTFYKEVPDVSFGDKLKNTFMSIGKNIGFALPDVASDVVGGTAGALTLATTRSPPLATTAAGGVAGATEVGRGMLDRALAGESTNVLDIDPTQVAKKAALGAGGQFAGGKIAGMIERNRLKISPFDQAMVTPQSLAKARELTQRAKARGIDLRPAQALNAPSLLRQERKLGRFDDVVDQLTASVRKQYDQVKSSLIDQIGLLGRNPQGSEQGVKLWREKAKQIISNAQTARTKAADPFYKKAFDSGAQPDLGETISLVESMVSQTARNTVRHNELTKILNQLADPVKLGKKTDWEQKLDFRQAHDLKISLDGIIGPLKTQGQKPSVVKALKNDLIDIQNSLNNTLKNTHAKYKEGSKIFSDMSPEVQLLEQGGIGVLANTRGLDRTQIAKTIFGGSSMGPDEIKRMHAAFKLAGAQKEWNQGLAAYLDDIADEAMKSSKGNPAKYFFDNTIGNPRIRRVLKSALPDESKQGFIEFFKILRAASRGMAEGSATATDLGEVLFADKAKGLMKGAGKITKPWDWAESIVDYIAGVFAPGQRQKLLKHLTSDTGFKQLEGLSLMQPNTKAAVAAVGNILVNSGVSAASATLPKKTIPPKNPTALSAYNQSLKQAPRLSK
mgnify:CR=1 FL=1|tara:strand:- start:945 stop:3176 length:2232 start_codon:yes stop_codon:yes gene_type:complete